MDDRPQSVADARAGAPSSVLIELLREILQQAGNEQMAAHSAGDAIAKSKKRYERQQVIGIYSNALAELNRRESV